MKGSVRKRPSGNWEARYRDPDGRHRSRCFRTKKEADRFLVTNAAALQQGAWIDPTLGKITLRTWADQWTATRPARTTTKAKSASHLAVHVLPSLGDMPLSAITPLHVRSFVASLTDKGLAPSSVRSVVGTLTAVLASAESSALIVRSPARNLELPKDTADERVFLTPERVARLAETVPDRYRALVLMAAYTGMRWGELAGLKVGRLNLLRRNVEVAETLTEVRGHFSYGPPKSKAGRRTVSLPAALADTLAAHLASYGTGQDRLVFTTRTGAPLSRGHFRARVWQPAVRRAGLDPAPTFHDMRHTHVGFLIANGVPVKAIQTRLGHASITTTLNTYGHLLPEVDEAVRDGLDATLRRASETAPVGRTRDDDPTATVTMIV